MSNLYKKKDNDDKGNISNLRNRKKSDDDNSNNINDISNNKRNKDEKLFQHFLMKLKKTFTEFQKHFSRNSSKIFYVI